MGKLRKLHEIDWIVHFILLHSIQPMIYYSRKSLEYFKGIHTYQTTVINYYPNIYIVLSHLNVNLVCLTPTIDPINESWSEFRFNQRNCNISGRTVVLGKSGFLYFNNASLNTTSRVFRNSQSDWVNQIALSTVSQNARSRVFRNLDIWTCRLSLAYYPEQST